MKSGGWWAAILGGTAIVSGGVSFGLGATVFRESRTNVILLERTAASLAIPPSFMSAREDEASITIVEASDFECLFCGRVQPVIERLREEYSGRVRHAFVPFPRGGVAYKEVYGTAYLAAMNQGKGAELRAALFDRKLWKGTRDEETRRRKATEAVLSAAEDLGLEMERFRADMKASSTRAAWDQAVDELKRGGIRATPTLFIDGYQVRGALGLDGYRQVMGSIVSD